MNPAEHARLAQLVAGRISADFLAGYYGINWAGNAGLREAIGHYYGPRSARLVLTEVEVTRSALEAFLQAQRALPLKWMAARLGMEARSLDELLGRRAELGLPRPYILYDDLVDEGLKDDLLQSLRTLRFRTFGSHRDFCRCLHDALHNEIGFDPQPLYCATSQELDEPSQWWFAHDFDCLTLQPLSVKHSMWLDFHKPLNLPPDRCSKLFYSNNRDELRPHVAGTGEPQDLDYYLHATHVAGGA